MGRTKKKSGGERMTLREELITLLSGEELQNKMCRALIEAAIDGKPKAWETVRDTIGEKPGSEDPRMVRKDVPLAELDMSSLTDEQLREILAQRE